MKCVHVGSHTIWSKEILKNAIAVLRNIYDIVTGDESIYACESEIRQQSTIWVLQVARWAKSNKSCLLLHRLCKRHLYLHLSRILRKYLVRSCVSPPLDLYVEKVNLADSDWYWSWKYFEKITKNSFCLPLLSIMYLIFATNTLGPLVDIFISMDRLKRKSCIS